ncbi:response regulator transcription factor [Bacillus aquiflavi]|uniref:Response regulator transcription factor n=1 Tax=Bacillus aquiflavi TaxID=2672567 RepID=A0A6B3VYW8_9BACI|nr:response regulator transcription factor [Bacillus aquiflavi]MBA4536418.1 response regulator transcription factor [Bacillus aquiflavi]NEY80786.1 response regulator transcription factor [Bacillus aquiflavi]
MEAKILVVEDDEAIASLLCNHIEKYGYKGVKVTDFNEVLQIFHHIQPHLVLMDVNLPKFDGYYWCRQIRNTSLCPIIFISARTSEIDQIYALENGADDFITKPFYYDIVIAKIKSHLRRAYGEYSTKEKDRIIEVNGVFLDDERLEVKYKDRTVLLTHKECLLLRLLMERHSKVVTRESMLDKIWDDQHFVDENTLNVNISRLRKKFEEIGLDHVIETIRGKGYIFAP